MSIPQNINQGMFLGGINFTQKNVGSTKENNKSTLVSNKFAIIKGIQLSYGEFPQKKYHF